MATQRNLLVDDLNHQIIALLADNPRATHRDIAAQLGASEPTIAARVRQLFAGNVIRVVYQRSLRAAPVPHHMAILDLWVDEASAIDFVGREIAALPEALTVYATSRRPELVAHVHAETPPALGELVMRIGERIAGLGRLTVSTCLAMNRYREHIGNLGVPPSPVPAGETPREKLLALLSVDARQTIKALSQALGLSETAVRHHVRMLEREGYRPALVADAAALGYDVWTELRVTVAAQHLRGALEALAHVEGITVTGHISGTANLMVFYAASNVEELDRFVNTHIRAMPGMIDFALMRIPYVLKANYNLVL